MLPRRIYVTEADICYRGEYMLPRRIYVTEADICYRGGYMRWRVHIIETILVYFTSNRNHSSIFQVRFYSSSNHSLGNNLT